MGMILSTYKKSSKIGQLYNWWAIHYASPDFKFINNIGWHMPSLNDWNALIASTGTTGGGKLKEIGFIWWNSPNTGATNEKMFNGKGGGYRLANGTFADLKNKGYHLVSYSDGYSNILSSLELFYNSNAINVSYALTKNCGISVRLIKDSTTLTEGQSGTYTGNDGKVYRTICIAGIEWLADNLDETKYRDGTNIPLVTDNTAWASLSTGARCYYPI